MKDVISLEKVTKKLGRREILKDVTLTVNQGDIFGYLGPNGAGKTTTIRIILGLIAVTSGEARVLGRKAGEDGVRQKIGFVLETDGLYDNLSAVDNLIYYARLYAVPHRMESIQKAIQMAGLTGRSGDKVGTYSRGMRQRLALARAMVPDPDVLILDEPTAGVDPSGQIEIRNILLEMAHKEKKTILLSSHNLDEVQRICNRIALIHSGQILIYGELEKIQQEMSHGEVVIETADTLEDTLLEEMQTFPELALRSQEGNRLTIAAGKNLDVPSIITWLSSRGVKIEQVRKQEASLEEIYMAILREAGQSQEEKQNRNE